MLAQLHDFRDLADDACKMSQEDLSTLNSLIEANKMSDNLFEFKLLEKEKVFPGEKFNIKTSEINRALNGIDCKREEISVKIDLEERLKGLTIQEELIDKREAVNRDVGLKIEEEVEIPIENEGKLVYYNLEGVEFDEERCLDNARSFLQELGQNKCDIEEINNESPLKHAKFNKELFKDRMKSENGKNSVRKLQKNLEMLTFYEEMDQ